MELLGVIDLQNPKCIKRIKQKQLCYAEKYPTDNIYWDIYNVSLKIKIKIFVIFYIKLFLNIY